MNDSDQPIGSLQFVPSRLGEVQVSTSPESRPLGGVVESTTDGHDVRNGDVWWHWPAAHDVGICRFSGYSFN